MLDVGDPAFTGAVLVGRGGEELLDQRSATAFQIASVSKQFTAAAVLALAKRGELSIEDQLARWFPACPADWAPITVHQLVTNTSGIGHWADYAEIDLYRELPPDELVAMFFAQPLKFAPGTRWSYSSPGFVLLARIVESTAGVPYGAFLGHELFEPLGLDRTSVARPPADAAQGTSSGEPVPSFELETVAMGAGDIWSTTHDLARWNGAVASTPLHAPRVRISPDVSYGYGLFVGRIAGRDAVYHAGDNRGFRAFNAWLPDDGTTVVVLANDDQVNVEAIGENLIARLR